MSEHNDLSVGVDPHTNHYADPDRRELIDPVFNAIWNEIKSWDINVPEAYDGYCGATGNHAAAILRAISETHSAVPHEEIERLRGAVTALKEELRDPELGVRIAIETIFVACAALDAAQQEEGNE